MADEFYGGCPFRFKVNDAIATEFLQGRKHIFVSIGTIKADSYFADTRATVHLWNKRRGSDLNRFFRLEYSFDNRQFPPLKMRFTLEQEMEHDRYSMTPAEPMPEGPPICRQDLDSHPGCGSLFLRRGTEPACKNRPLPLLRLACFCRRQQLGCAATRPLEVPPALRARPHTGALGRGLLPPGSPQRRTRRSSCRYRAPPESSGNAAGWRR